MSEYRRIWVEAIKANQRMLLNRSAGAEDFERLLARHPADGMLFLERGEAFEWLKLLDEADADYRQAEVRLTSPHWKEVARLAQRRIQRTRAQKFGARFISCGNQALRRFEYK
jgi:hypothetical protein